MSNQEILKPPQAGGSALNDGLYMMVETCRECRQVLTSEEIEYYECRCEQCETEWMGEIEAWRLGGGNAKFDALYSLPKPTLN